jgi:hypothetical protein
MQIIDITNGIKNNIMLTLGSVTNSFDFFLSTADIRKMVPIIKPNSPIPNKKTRNVVIIAIAPIFFKL